MEFDLAQGIAILQRTPQILRAWLEGLPEPWVHNNEGEDTWSPYDVLGHFIHGERTDWIPRAEIILAEGGNKEFEPFDRFAQFDDSPGRSLAELLDTFANLRTRNLAALRGLDLKPADYQRTGIHPELGAVTLGELLATWVVHDLDHLAQIAETMARQYSDQVGPWQAYLGILHE